MLLKKSIFYIISITIGHDIFQIKNESSFEDTDTRTDILDIDIVKEELNISTDNQTDVIEDFTKEQDNLILDISQVTSETTITVSKEIYQDFDDVSFKLKDILNLIMNSSTVYLNLLLMKGFMLFCWRE